MSTPAETFNAITLENGWTLDDTADFIAEEAPRVAGRTWDEYRALSRVGSRFRISRATRRAFYAFAASHGRRARA